MQKIFVLSFMLFLNLCPLIAQQSSGEVHALGKIKKADLLKAPFEEWYTPGYEGYQPNPDILARLRELDLSKYSLQIFFGSWCGDSRRELPRFLKVVDALSIPENNVEIIGVDRGESYKQSPDGEEIGKAIYRVPTFIFYKEGEALGRIVEYPVVSLERDLLTLLEEEAYTPNYFSYPYLTHWQEEGILKDQNVSLIGLANQIRDKIFSSSELNAAGYVFLYRGEIVEAMQVFRINTILYPDVANTFDSLGKAFMAAGDIENALRAYESALALEPESAYLTQTIEKLKASTSAPKLGK